MRIAKRPACKIEKNKIHYPIYCMKCKVTYYKWEDFFVIESMFTKLVCDNEEK